MPALLVQGPSPRNAALEDIVARHVDKRTWGHIYQLDVEVTGERLILRGRTSTYYTKQLAVAAAREILGGSDLTLDLQIDVGPAAARLSEGRDRSPAPREAFDI